MRDGWPSLTALAVALARGIGTAPEVVDASAPYLVPPPLGRALSWVTRETTPSVVRSALRIASLGIVDHVSLRSAAIDTALAQALDSGIPQLVVLGAGLDGRAWRLPSLHDTTVFEIDHPSTQLGKQARTNGRPTAAAEVRFVAVDFEHDDLEQCLERSDHDAERPTVWIWEGVTPYLNRAAIETSLAAIARRSAPASRLLMTYMIPRVLPWNSSALERVARAAFAALGEPLRGAIETDTLTRDLAAHGFVLLTDSNSRQWARQHRGSAKLATPLSAERLAVAERVGVRH